jgi:hypothetical protein
MERTLPILSGHAESANEETARPLLHAQHILHLFSILFLLLCVTFYPISTATDHVFSAQGSEKRLDPKTNRQEHPKRLFSTF